ncbi:hypothetical protein [Hymenobacter sp. BT190]|uniref:hypothetical protein n=1 Tax=Hymenobacter sp. BT190 TaxID=2763505 RepID=UPI001650E09C|nr:hypothetical protein [Hymenobacter sp. BT190]MBC6698568.1 hypothetical protein [Hymenobacter sp. BT190]
MEQQMTTQTFDMKLISLPKYWVGLLALIVIVLLSFVAAAHLNVGKMGLIVAMTGGALAGIFFMQWLAVYRAVATVTPSGLNLHLMNGKLLMVIAFAEVASYRHKSNRNWDELRFKFFDGTRQRIVADSGRVEFWELVHAVNQIVERHYRPTADSAGPTIPAELSVAQQRHPDREVMAHEKSFWEKPISTVFFWMITGALALALLAAALTDDAGLLGLFVGGWVFYLIPWLLHIDQRIKNREAAKR